ncbi:DUF221-domain-containing protein [Saitoella complicata NRRL Y-17804]|uniref:DUF221-domain-containing protein n=1 Tax=Saitoella complicata (strain BCRC 22490 / CBS 7301 / JCM 7358 / NBRC 10748 / NRRL Y-17804) TaxID=698492 RepID=A0A0E9NR43_SAICN|nr:DUF221-domain-containing protein [Saitoella complicata NRRL Y-17804]ODQ51673.1 DUF221-domain-containing protein [Saitoella complicata NRRL Y-17804]GAO52273.1 hypothetical protein G7K_6353-t1 [Saitoella complicata NRRL Y-17804]
MSSTATSDSSSGGTSLSAWLTTFIPSAAVFAIEIGLFFYLRRIYKRIYEPKSVVDTQRKVGSPPATFMGVLKELLKSQTLEDTIQTAGLDAYFFLRFVRLIVFIFGASMLLVWPILMPINAVDGKGNKGLDMLAYSNVGLNHTSRYWAHWVLAWLFIGFVLYMFYRELVHYKNTRFAWLRSREHSGLASARTLLVTNVPDELSTEEKIKERFGQDKVKKVFLVRDMTKLLDDVQTRDKNAAKLETSVSSLIKMALKNARKNKNIKGVDAESGRIADRYVPAKKYPTHRLPVWKIPFALPLIGKKVNSIDYCTEELARLNPEIAEGQQREDSYELIGAAFIEFHRQADMHRTFFELSGRKVATSILPPSHLETDPRDIVWSNLGPSPHVLFVKKIVAYGAICWLIVFFAIPVAFVGSISNLTYLTNKAPWLNFIYKLPSALLGLITGLLPSVMLAVLMALVPVFMRLAAKIGGAKTYTAVELTTQKMYFAFLLIQEFLVVAIASSATAMGTQIAQDPSSASAIVAEQLPKSSNFYFSYFVLQGLTIAAGRLLQIVALLLFFVFNKFLDNTPRKKWNRWNLLGGRQWGTEYPAFTNLALIAFTYSIVTPFIMFIVVLTFGLFYLAYLYNLRYVWEFRLDSGGLFFPVAIDQVMGGIYLLEVLFIGLFFAARDAQNNLCAIPQAVLMIVALVITALFHIWLKWKLKPFEETLPRDEVFAESDHPFSDAHKIPSVEGAVVPDTAAQGFDGEIMSEGYKNEALRAFPPTIWIPKDHLGIGEDEARRITDRQVEASYEHAEIAEKGDISVDGRPPDYQEIDFTRR